jgi:hypothetical protein
MVGRGGGVREEKKQMGWVVGEHEGRVNGNK